MRIRGTKPEFWKSKRIASVPWDARLVLKGLESYVDDNGVGIDDIELIVAAVFPRDMSRESRETIARVSEAITQLHRAGLVHRYEADGDHLIYISFWESTQRIDKPGKGRLPRPDGTFDYNASEIRESVARVPETHAPVTGEQGNRGTGESLVPLRTGVTSETTKFSNPRNHANRIVQSWLDATPTRPPSKIIADALVQVTAMVSEQIPDQFIAAGLAEWWQGKYPPTTIPNYVANAQKQTAPKMSTGTRRAADIMAIDTSSIPERASK